MITQINDLSKITLLIEKDLEKSIDELRVEIHDRVKNRTPVATGKARDGWEIEGKDIVNRIPYIGSLEQGTSTKAPNGMVSVTLIEVDSILATILNK